MPHPYKILNLRGYFSCKTIEIISRRRRENFLDWGEGQLAAHPQAKSEMTRLGKWRVAKWPYLPTSGEFNLFTFLFFSFCDGRISFLDACKWLH